MLELQREAKSELGAQVPTAARLRIGAIESVLHSWLMPWLESLQQAEHPPELELTVETTPVLLDLMRRGAVDLIFATLPVDGESIRSRSLPSMRMQFVGHEKRHRKRRYALSEIAEFDLMTFQRGSQPYVMLLDSLSRHGVTPRKVHAVSSISAMAQLVVGGFGIAALPSAAVDRLRTSQPLRPLPCDVELALLPIHASYRHDPSLADIDAVVRSAMEFSGARLVSSSASSKKSMKTP
jgi:DNA-binding transcriptional LysR family regulator